MKRVIKMSQAWTAAFAFGVLLTGCGGSSDSKDVSEGPVGPETGGSVNEPILPQPDRSAVLSWSAPTMRANGTDTIELYELDEYIIEYGQDVDSLDRKVTVSGEAEPVMAHKISGLGAGTWYFRVSVEDDDGFRSAPSDTVEKTFES